MYYVDQINFIFFINYKAGEKILISYQLYIGFIAGEKILNSLLVIGFIAGEKIYRLYSG